jgi:hypothetical protein
MARLFSRCPGKIREISPKKPYSSTTLAEILDQLAQHTIRIIDV